MAEGRGNRKGKASSGRVQEPETILGQDLTGDEGYVASQGNGSMDPIDRVAQLYQFLRSPQVDQTIRRFVASRKTRQLIASGLSILEVVVILLPLMKKLGERVGDMTTLVKQSSHPRRSGTARTRASRSLAAHGSSVH